MSMLRWRRIARWPTFSTSAAATSATAATARWSDALELSGGRKPLVAIGLSGGVDSAVAAHELLSRGCDVVGVHLRSWDQEEESADGRPASGECGEADRRDAQRVAAALGIELHDVDLVSEYWRDVFEPFLGGLRAGMTPNPDLPCNVHIKFDALLRHACGRLGADWLATGHYAQLRRARPGEGDGCEPTLLRGLDPLKDQSYFLAAVPPQSWRRVLLPLGGWEKRRVRQRAEELGLVSVSAKRSSAGLCFVGRRRFDRFLEGYLQAAPGTVRSVEGDRREVVAEHGGTWNYTIGQGARIGGGASKMFVVGKDAEADVVWVGEGTDHPALYARELISCADVCWGGAGPAAAEASALRCQVRYSHEAADCEVEVLSEHGGGEGSGFEGSALFRSAPEEGQQGGERLLVRFAERQRALTPGQALVLYDASGAVVASATIAAFGRTQFEEHTKSK